MPPVHTAVGENLDLRLELSLVQLEVVNGAGSHVAVLREARAPAPDERAAGLAKAVGHCGSRSRRLVVSPSGEVVLATVEFEVGVVDGEVGGEHGRGDFAAVVAVAEEGVDQTWSDNRLFMVLGINL
jgi:hypothetical protein